MSNKEERISKEEGDEQIRQSLRVMDEGIPKQSSEENIYEQA